jgi:hypothetical protein
MVAQGQSASPVIVGYTPLRSPLKSARDDDGVWERPRMLSVGGIGTIGEEGSEKLLK